MLKSYEAITSFNILNLRFLSNHKVILSFDVQNVLVSAPEFAKAILKKGISYIKASKVEMQLTDGFELFEKYKIKFAPIALSKVQDSQLLYDCFKI